MKSIIKQILYGKKGNSDCIKFTKEYYDCLDKAVTLENELKTKLESKPELFDFYLEVSDAVTALSAETAAAYYIEGFKLGVSLGLELA